MPNSVNTKEEKWYTCKIQVNSRKKNCVMVLIKCKISDNQYIFDQNIMGPMLRLTALLNGRPL